MSIKHSDHLCGRVMGAIEIKMPSPKSKDKRVLSLSETTQQFYAPKEERKKRWNRKKAKKGKR